jgi:potassium-transporting ATPase KdpC subunit
VRAQVVTALRALVVFTLLFGLGYPLAVTAAARVLAPEAAAGSLLRDDQGRVVGSQLRAQATDDTAYFQPRPSVADGTSIATAASNLGPRHPELATAVGARADDYRERNGLAVGAPVPVDAVTASGSGFDPHISVANARLQAPRVAQARDISLEDVITAIEAHTHGRDLGFLGEPRVEVLPLNLELDAITRPGN